MTPISCNWCGGRGCISCAAARQDREAEYKKRFPDGPKPIFTASKDKPDEMAQLKEIFHADAIAKAFGPGGDGIEGIEKKCKEVMEKRAGP